MPYDIRRAVVIGSGTMGGGLAAHLANVGIRVTLLDIVPTTLTLEEEAAGRTLRDPVVRNRIVNDGLQRILNARPAALYAPDNAALITPGNLEDDFEAVGEADWILEAVVEHLDTKRALMARIEEARRPGSIVSSNTSGLPIHALAEGRGEEFRAHFLGTHFFNPPRYLRLMEVIPHAGTDPEVVAAMTRFGENVLGKGVVVCKDTPNFIANRFASAAGAFEAAYTLDHGYTFEQADALAGPLIGRPKTAIFRLMDLIGLDVLVDVNAHVAEAAPDDEARDWLLHEGTHTFLQKMLDKGYLGNKAGQGIYKRVQNDGQTDFLVIDPDTLDYRPQEKVRFDSVGAARKIPDLGERLKALLAADDRAADFVRAITTFRLAYASHRVPEIADTLVAIDDAVRWGFAFEAGPFETWDMLGVAETLESMQAGGYPAADWVRDMLDGGHPTFYRYEKGVKTGYYDLVARRYGPLESDLRAQSVQQFKAAHGVVDGNDEASLVDLGDGVLLLEFHSKANTLGEGTFQMGWQALDHLQGDFDALVIGNDGSLFCGGANLDLEQLQRSDKPLDAVERLVKDVQDLAMALRYAPRPVVTAPFDRALGGGAEVVLAGARVVAGAELYMGLVEMGVGLIPAGGGCKELLRRILNPVMRTKNADPLPHLQRIFEQIGFAKVSSSAAEARQMDFLGPADRVVANRAHLLIEAKREALHLVASGYRPPVQEKIYAAGRDALAALEVGIFLLEDAAYASAYDARLARKLAYVLTGGELSAPTWVDEQYILDLEREAFVSLVMEPKTVERIVHMLTTGKPLRN